MYKYLLIESTSYYTFLNKDILVTVDSTQKSKISWRKITVGHEQPADQGPRTKAVLTLTSSRPSNWNSPNKVLASASVNPPTLCPGLKQHSCTKCFPGRRANLWATWCPRLSSRVQLEVQQFTAMWSEVHWNYFLGQLIFPKTALFTLTTHICNRCEFAL